MVARGWRSGMVDGWFSASGASASRPEELAPGLGLLADGYQLSEVQAKEILEMRLHRLTGLEQEKLTDEYRQLLDTIRGLIEILESPGRLLEVIRSKLYTLQDKFGDVRLPYIRPRQDTHN